MFSSLLKWSGYWGENNSLKPEKLHPFFKDFSRTSFDFQGPPTRKVISQIVQKCTFQSILIGLKGLSCLLHQLLYIFQFSCLKLIVNCCIKQKRFAQITINFSQLWFSTTRKAWKPLSRPLRSKLKKIQGLFKGWHRNLRTFQEKWNPRTSPKFQGLFKTVRTPFKNSETGPNTEIKVRVIWTVINLHNLMVYWDLFDKVT